MADRPPPPAGASLSELVEVMATLLSDDGCPWDREQTLETLLPYLVEETFEVIEAIESAAPADHRVELGDLLFQIVFQAALRQRDGAFDIDDVVASIRDKLVRRHPHVFGDAQVDDAGTVLTQWEAIKAQEHADKGSVRRTLDGVPGGMPALARAQKLSARAARVGFDWPDIDACVDKVHEEIDEVRQAIIHGNKDDLREEIGDLLFAAVSVARKAGIDAEGALRGANRKFTARFEAVEDRLKDLGKSPKDSNLEEMDRLWNEVKRRVTRR